MIVHVRSKDLMIIHNWEVIKLIEEKDTGNDRKEWLHPFPGFHVDTFPFVITSGWKAFSLINVKTGSMQVLIKTPARYRSA